jgi:hypothetical protein
VRVDRSNTHRDLEPTFIFDNNVWDGILGLSSGQPYVYIGYWDEGFWYLGVCKTWA